MKKSRKKAVAPKPQLLSMRIGELANDYRLARGDILTLGLGRGETKRHLAVNVLRIDKLLAEDIIDENQHLSGRRLIELWHRSGRPVLRAARYEERAGRCEEAYTIIDRMTALDIYLAVARLMRPHHWSLVYAVCIEELTCYDAARQAGIGRNRATGLVREALDQLGLCLSKARKQAKERVKSCPGK